MASQLKRSSGGRPKPLRFRRESELGSRSSLGQPIGGPIAEQPEVEFTEAQHSPYRQSYQLRDEGPSATSEEGTIEPRSMTVPLQQPTAIKQESQDTTSTRPNFLASRKNSEQYFTMSPERQDSPQPFQSPPYRASPLPSQPPSRQGTTDFSVDAVPRPWAAATRPDSPSQPPSQSRWEQIRNAVGTIAANAPEPTEPPPPSRPALSSRGSSSSLASSFTHVQYVPPPVPQTPAPSSKTPRTGRFGFRQVVDQATTQLSLNAAARFESDLRRACWDARYGDMGSVSGHSNDPRADIYSQPLPTGIGSSFSIPLTAASSAIFGDRATPKRPAQTSGTPSLSYSLRPLQQALLAHAPLTTASTGPSQMRLPMEDEVLSVLLVPFLDSSGSDEADNEQWLATEIFEMITKTWKSSSPETELERWLWCTKAAGSTSSTPVRRRILVILSAVLFSPAERSFPARSPLVLQTLVRSVVMLHRSLGSEDQAENRLMHDIIIRIWRGDCGNLTAKDLTDEYGVLCTVADEDREPDLRALVLVEGVVRCMQVGTESARRWALHRLEQYWQEESAESLSHDMSSMEIQIRLRKLITFSRLALLLTRSFEELDDPLASREDAATIIRIIQTRVLPELAVISLDIAEADTARRTVARLVLDALCLGGSKVTGHVGALLVEWWADTKRWKVVLEKELIENLGVEVEWPLTIRLMMALAKELHPDIRQTYVAFSLPFFFERLIDDPPAPSTALTTLLSTLAEAFPTLFYRPLFVCAASTKDTTVVTHLRVLSAVSNHLPSFWTANDEMIAVALMSDPGNSFLKGKGKENPGPSWGKPRLGQCIVILELIAHLQKLTSEKKDPTAPYENSKEPVVRFMGALEARLAIMMDAREAASLFPVSHRILLTWLLFEMRLFTRSLKSAPWLARVIYWTTQAYVGAPLVFGETEAIEGVEPNKSVIDSAAFEEWESTKKAIFAVYTDSSNRSRPMSAKRQSQYRMSFLLAGAATSAPAVDTTPNFDRTKLLSSAPPTLAAATLPLLVAVCGLLGSDEYEKLAHPLWNEYLASKEKSVFAPATFLVMQCAEKASSTLLTMIQADLTSSVRANAVTLVSKLFSWRLQVLSQTFFSDKSRRRPFRMTRRPISFVASDVGNARYVPPELPEQAHLQVGASLPPELRGRLLDLGWAENRNEEEQEAQRWDRAPISLLPSTDLELLGTNQSKGSTDPNGDAEGRQNKGLLRRKSSGAGHISGMRKKGIFVPPLLTLVPLVVNLLTDSDIIVSDIANNLIATLMRDDPVLLVRGLMEDLSDAMQDHEQTLNTLRLFTHAQERLPPGFVHHIFNHLAGLVRTTSRQSGQDIARVVARCLPILVDLVPQVCEMSYRELCRNKLDLLILPTLAPIPSGLKLSPRPAMTPGLMQATLTRTAQNLILLNVIQQSPKDINGIRKPYAQLAQLAVELEDLLDLHPMTIADYVPKRKRPPRSAEEMQYLRMTSPLARSYLLMCTEMFKSLSRHMNNHAELGKYMDGISRIVLLRGDDVGIVALALIAYMAASTRFRRMFSSESGFSLFMPVLLKVYAESEGDQAIRRAIEYSMRRFYSLHKEICAFQTLEAASHIIHQSQMEVDDQEWFAGNVFDLVACLSRTTMATEQDLAGIHGMNQMQEREALITMVNEKPELLLPNLTRTATQTSLVHPDLANLAPMEVFEEGTRFALDDFVRLFLTIIPHNPLIVRAQYFLKLLRLLTPSFYNASSSARNVLREGIHAFGPAVFDRLQSRPKPEKEKEPQKEKGTETTAKAAAKAEPEKKAVPEAPTTRLYAVKPTAPSDQGSMRKEYILLLVSYMRSGGQFDRWAMGRILQLVREALRDGAQSLADPVSQFMDAYSALLLKRDSNPGPKVAIAVLKEISPLFRIYGSIVDFSPVLNNIIQMTKESEMSNDRDFVRMVVKDWCAPAAEMCSILAEEGMLTSTSIRDPTVTLLAVMVSLPDVDPIATIESQSPTSRFLAGIVLPLCLVLETSQQVASRSQWQDVWKQNAHQKAWIRLVAYAMSVTDPSIRGVQETKATSSEKGSNQADKGKRSDKEVAMAFTVALQIVKLSSLRAEQDLSATLAGVWSRVAIFVQDSLREGDASFTLQQASIQVSQNTPPISPILGPSVSVLSPTIAPERPFSFAQGSFNLGSPVPPPTMTGSIRLVDYLLWSTLELVCLHRSPLLLQLKFWIQEKMLNFDERIHSNLLNSPGGPSSPAFRPSNRESRRVSTLFAKPRRSGNRSAGMSPEASPAFPAVGGSRLSRSPSLLSLGGGMSHRPGSALDSPTDRYDRFPNASPVLGASSTVPRIRHLGPTGRSEGLTIPPNFPGLAGRSGPGSRTGSTDDQVNAGLASERVSSSSLVKTSHWRVRVVQSCMGYDPLPMDFDHNEGFGGERDIRAWNRAQALKAVLDETRALLAEFAEWFDPVRVEQVDVSRSGTIGRS
ncbi:hypothetical protein FRC04_001474 [Tulasnella sp. 424]|nr:hypothetical protein FRC04_001474 [Tulasnella sp. 424]